VWNQPLKKSPQQRRSRRDLETRYLQQRSDTRVTLVLGFISVAALLWYFAHQQLLLYGDAVAHINIARRVVDNRHPLQSYGQLGTVWLPLQHIAMLPFVWSDGLWRTGIAGAIPAMLAYVLGGWGIFRLVKPHASERVAYLATATYALNPNLLYMQTTAMNEPIFLAFFIWSLVYLDEFVRTTSPQPTHPAEAPDPQRSLEMCGITLAAGAYTRYDGWFVAAVILPLLVWRFVTWRARNENASRPGGLTKSLAEVLLLNALVPIYWLIYTYNVSGYALDFATGPYSAKAIALRSTAQGAPPYPGQHNIFTAALYFLKAAKLNTGQGLWGQLLFAAALAGSALALYHFRRYGVLLLLWLPLPFYALSVAYGSVPIYIPDWYPFSYYNVRYGLELLPVFAVFVALLAGFALKRAGSRTPQIAVYAVLVTLVACGYLSLYRRTPITLREAQVNSRARVSMEQALARILAQLPRTSIFLMYQADHPGALQQAGVPLRHVISESSHPDWEWALLDPAHHSDYLVACQGDPVWAALRHSQPDLVEMLAISVPAQSHCVVYQSKVPPREAPHP
jgi:hypothetical protein